MGLIFKNKRNTKNTADNTSSATNNISVHSEQDFYYTLGSDINNISKNTDYAVRRVNKLDKKVDRIWNELDKHRKEIEDIKGRLDEIE